ncbi:TonB-dependent siderophore receptor [Marinobacterium mangrovicola]|uniref:Outer membrane receptor for ferric coprogen and ferric-rhodotorulic acid n=1 Tax=Marinobacterium mangrovicola TaxID=1476959 RepID=A0A4V2PEG1_9GAMM|nr:TonB-dependent siderophore receptor [Marinobacterium mangrovicola]TCK08966.1 outer membrane receptor for ferric coprogen and ferric-rhodotorulic acid [Marinobacterium mangrovicola]
MPTQPALNRLNQAIRKTRAFHLPRYSASAVLLAALSAPIAMQVQAAEATFNIPAQNLSQALNTFGRQSGYQVLYSPNDLAGLTSSAVEGRMEVNSALSRLLQGTSMNYSIEGSSITVSSGNGDSASLSTIKVEGDSDFARGVTENTGSYTTGATSTATKMNLSIRETPQSVSVITQQKIEDQNYQTVDEALQDTTGINVSRVGATRWEYISRGATIDNIQYDGVSSHVHYYARDIIGDDVMAMYDRVEVVRGATGLTQGAGDPSASINLVRKRPTAENQTSISGSASVFGNGRLTFDTSGALNESETLRGRFVSSVQGGDDFEEDSERENYLYYAVLDADLTESTLLSLGLSHQKTHHDGYSWGGFPTKTDGSFYDLRPEDNLAADWEYLDREENAAYLDLEQALANEWKLKVSGRYSKAQSEMLASYTWRYSGDLVKDVRAYDYDHKARSLDIHANGPFDLFGREHKLVIGANYDQEILSYLGGSGTRLPIDPENWDPSSTERQHIDVGSILATYDQKQYGLYSALQLNPMDDLNLVLGTRVSWFDYGSETTFASWSDYQEDGYVLPYYGLTYDLSDTLTAYTSYTEIFQPQQNYDISGSLLPPEEGNNKEIGLKFESLDGRFNGSIALFETNRDNLATRLDNVNYCNPAFSSCYEAAERVRTRGFEIDASGEITDRWNLSAGYTYSESEYVEGANKGETYYSYNTPRHSFKLSSVYQLGGDLYRFSIGGSMRAQSKIYKTGTGYRIEQPSYAVFDAMTKYQMNPQTRLQLNINNIFDKEYYSSLGGSGTNYGPFMGEPRNITLSFKHDF